jgi:hypothetical protein
VQKSALKAFELAISMLAELNKRVPVAITSENVNDIMNTLIYDSVFSWFSLYCITQLGLRITSILIMITNDIQNDMAVNTIDCVIYYNVILY